ncbi:MULTISPECIES: alpha amylase N-terminal ig-like domain-containing protein [Aeromonas]|uniref:Alpha amylase N-terminal ig-like domain-containing protein n=1 Tax=Aeromonas allosaccharophila TaxID=656 RepID=A0A7T2PCB0_9GAMM|nr:alpha amylase N-terminal ig-like domain-containing protein [Aeromonas allosaccharophila]QPR53042.1 alpha amylase N-terminal ig-like domain-containing protein [Aeromonas allosaccharophila]
MDKKITRAAIFHRSHTNMSYAYSSNQLHMRLRTAKGEVTEVFLRAGDPFDWASQGGGGI